MSDAAKYVIEIPEPSGYGAYELKEVIRKYTVRGYLYTVGLILLLFLLYVATQVVKERSNAAPKLAPIVRISITDLPPPTDGAEAAPPPPQQIINTGPAARAGTPVPVPDAQITAEMKDFATMDVCREHHLLVVMG